MSYSDTNVSNLIINSLTKSELSDMVEAGTVPANQIFTITDDNVYADDLPTQGSSNLVKSGGVYSYINSQIGNIATLLEDLNSGSGV